MRAALWQGDQLGGHVGAVVSSGFPELDPELPGGGWPCQALTEVLQAQPGAAEWRLLGPAIRQAVAAGKALALVGPPRLPHVPGLQRIGIEEGHVIWFKAETPAERLWIARACGIVTHRQQPSTANGTVFLSLEDETGVVQVIVWRWLKEQQRAQVIDSRLLGVAGTWQRVGDVCNLIAGHLEDMTPLLGRLATESRDFR